MRVLIKAVLIEEKSSVCEKLEIEFIKLDELFGVEGKRKEKKMTPTFLTGLDRQWSVH